MKRGRGYRLDDLVVTPAATRAARDGYALSDIIEGWMAAYTNGHLGPIGGDGRPLPTQEVVDDARALARAALADTLGVPTAAEQLEISEATISRARARVAAVRADPDRLARAKAYIREEEPAP